jgi:hypothetical protein
MLNITSTVARDTVGLDVTYSGMKITVSAGSVNICGVQGQVEAVEHDVSSHATRPVMVYGYLYHDKSLNIDILVDEVGGDFGNSAYRFVPGGPYKLLHRLFHVLVPPGTQNLDDTIFTVYRLVPPPVQSEPVRSESAPGESREIPRVREVQDGSES